MEWADDNPFFLVISPDDAPNATIDLGERGWMQLHQNLLRVQGIWYLVGKERNDVPLSLRIWSGEQPYYVCRHVGVTGSGGGNEVKAYGIGKKRLDGITERLWILENGQICGGDDVEYFAMKLLHERGPRRE